MSTPQNRMASTTIGGSANRLKYNIWSRTEATAETMTSGRHKSAGMPVQKTPSAAARKPTPATPASRTVSRLPGCFGSPPTPFSMGLESSANGQSIHAFPAGVGANAVRQNCAPKRSKTATKIRMGILLVERFGHGRRQESCSPPPANAWQQKNPSQHHRDNCEYDIACNGRRIGSLILHGLAGHTRRRSRRLGGRRQGCLTGGGGRDLSSAPAPALDVAGVNRVGVVPDRSIGPTPIPQVPVRPVVGREGARAVLDRSEEHTSELQSRLHLVFRLLL